MAEADLSGQGTGLASHLYHSFTDKASYTTYTTAHYAKCAAGTAPFGNSYG